MRLRLLALAASAAMAALLPPGTKADGDAPLVLQPPPSVPAALAALAAAEGKYAALATLDLKTDSACGPNATDASRSGFVAPVGCSRVELVGSDEVTLEGVEPFDFAKQGRIHLVLRCTDTMGGFDGAYHLDSDLRMLFEDTGAPSGWRAEIFTDAFLDRPVRAARLAVADAVFGVRAQEEAFAPLGKPLPPHGGGFEGPSAATLAGLNPVEQQLRLWAKGGAINVSNDNTTLGLVFDSTTPLPIAMGGSHEEGKPELLAMPFIGGAGKRQLRYISDEEISIPLEAIFDSVAIDMPAIAIGVVDSIVQDAQVKLDMRFEAFGPNPCVAAAP